MESLNAVIKVDEIAKAISTEKKNAVQNNSISASTIVRYKNELNRVDLSKLKSHELKALMAIVSEVKNKGTTTLFLEAKDIKKMVGMEKTCNRDFYPILGELCSKLAGLVEVYTKKTEKNGKYKWEWIPKILFKEIRFDEEEQLVTVAIHDDMANIFNNWKTQTDGKYEYEQFTQFSMQYFNSIKGFSAQQLFRLLVEFSTAPSLYLSFSASKRLLGCEESRDDNFLEQSVKGAMKQFEKLSIIEPGWEILVDGNMRRKNKVLIIRYAFNHNVKQLSANTNKKKKITKELQAQIDMLRMMKKPEELIHLFAELGDYQEAVQTFESIYGYSI